MVHQKQKQKKIRYQQPKKLPFSRNDDGSFLLFSLLVSVFFLATKMHKLDDELPPPPKSSPFDYDIFVPVFLVIVISVQLILYVLKNKEKIKII